VGATTLRRLARAAAGVALLGLLGLTGSAAAAAPSAITGGVTAVGPSSATVSGTVNPNGEATTYHFEYGKTTTYGTNTPATSAGSGTANTNVSASLTGLSPNTTYHYRVVAVNSATANGLDAIFTTSSAPSVVTNPATSVGATSATLNGSVNPNGRPTTYYFEYGKTTTYGTKTAVQNAGTDSASVNVSASVTGLTTGQVYHFRLVATSDAGIVQGADASFTPASGPSVTTTAASSVTTSGAKLNGNVNPNGQSTTYFFEYGTSTSYGSKTASGSAGSGTRALNVSATVTGLAPGLYHFRLVATSAVGTTVGSDLTFGSAGPPLVQTGSAQSASTNAVTLTGSVNPQGASTNWYFDYGTSTAYGTKTAEKSAGSGTSAAGVSAAITNLQSGTTYHYRLVATSARGTTVGSDVTFTTAAAITISSSTLQVVYGHFATLSGTVSSRQSGVKVNILAQPFGATSFSTVSSVLTGAGGTWTYQARPKLATAYEANLPEGTSTPTTIGVRPSVSLRVITKARFSTRAVAGVAFKGKLVQLQRLLPGGRWVTVKRTRLNDKSSAIFAASSLPHGASTIRIAMSVNQAGPGYLAGFSRSVGYRR
jgi:phosphodiesterase/alkaline phosphatase D-like protein